MDTNYISLAVGRENKLTYQTIFHEYVHFLIDNNIGRSNIPRKRLEPSTTEAKAEDKGR